jgi:hypothetical protein
MKLGSAKKIQKLLLNRFPKSEHLQHCRCGERLP